MTIDTSGITEHMDVVDVDGEKIGKVDHFEDGRIKLTKTDSPDGKHHFVPVHWIDHVECRRFKSRALRG